MKQLKHPNLVHLHEVIDDDESDQLLVIMELLVNGTTSVAGAGVPFHSQDTARRFLVGATLGLEALHAQGVLHRDLKPENILIGNDGQTKLADLGVAQSLSPPVDEDGDGLIDDAEIAHAARCKAWTGTPAFLAPEVASGADEFDGMAVGDAPPVPTVHLIRFLSKPMVIAAFSARASAQTFARGVPHAAARHRPRARPARARPPHGDLHGAGVDEVGR